MDIQKISQIAAVVPELKILKHCQHFFPDDAIFDYAKNLASETAGDPFPLSSCLPSELVTVSVGEHLYCLGNEWRDDVGPCIAVLAVNAAGKYGTVGGWVPGAQNYFSVGTPGTKWTMEMLAYLVALINEPQVVLKSLAGSRQQRRLAQRGMGFAVDAWTRVSWDLSKETVAKVSRDPSFHKVPLHFRRGHWRRAQSHYQGAVQRPDAIRVEDRALWWQWIEGHWVGHPAFGVKKSVHAPKMSLGRLAKRRAA